MIDCRTTPPRLGELVAGELSQAAAAELLAHVDGCLRCSRHYEELRGTVGLLRRLDEPADRDFAAALHRRLVAAGPPPSPRPSLGALLRRCFASPRLSWAVAGVAVAGLLLTQLPWGGRSGGEIAEGQVAPTYRVPTARLAVVKIDFIAEQPVDDVEFAVELPEGLAFVSGGRELPERRFSWRAPLEQGSNSIPIAVRGKKAGRYRIQARARGAGVEAAHEVLLEVTKG